MEAQNAAETTVTFKCQYCGSEEQVTSIRGTYFGSSFDFCDACGETRDTENDMVNIVGPLAETPFFWAEDR